MILISTSKDNLGFKNILLTDGSMIVIEYLSSGKLSDRFANMSNFTAEDIASLAEQSNIAP